MAYIKNYRVRLSAFGLVVIFLSTGCSWVKLTPGGDKVRLLSQSEVTRCKALGNVTANSAATVGFIARNRDTVQEEIYSLARNNAAEMGGDTIVPKGPMIEGQQSFTVYRCINP